MIISSYTNHAAESGVIVHSKGSKSACISATTSAQHTVSADDFINKSDNVIVTVLPVGNVSNVTLKNSLENVHCSGVITGGSITSHTVQNVLYGGAGTSCNYGANVSAADKPITGTTTSTVENIAKIITDGSTKQIGYVKKIITTYDAIHYNKIGSGTLVDGSVIGRAIVCNNAAITNGKVLNGGRIVVKQGGNLTNTTIDGDGSIDILPGGTVTNISATTSYISAHQSNFATISAVTRITSSATYGIPTSGYVVSSGSTVSAPVWYKGTDSAGTSFANAVSICSGSVSSGITDLEEINVKDCSCIVNSSLGDDLAGTYTLMLSGIRDVDTYFKTAREAIWVKKGRTSLTDYLAIKYSVHSDGPYWDICRITSTGSTVTSTISACAPACTDIVETRQTDAATAKIAGTTIDVYNNGTLTSAGIPCNGVLNVHRSGIVNNTTISAYGTLNVNRYAEVGTVSAAITLSNGAKFITTVPGSAITSSGVTLPQVYTSRLNGANTLAGTIKVFGNQCVGISSGTGAIINAGDTIYLDTNASAIDFTLNSGGKLLVNSAATASGTVNQGGILTILNNAKGNATINAGGSLVIEPKGSGTYSVSSGAYLNCTISRYIAVNTIAGNTGIHGYYASDVTAATWSSTSAVSGLTLTSTGAFFIRYSVQRNGSTITGTMTGQGSTARNNIVYSGGSMALKDTDDGLAAIIYSGTDSEVVGEAIFAKHRLPGLVFANNSAYNVPTNAAIVINATDRVTFSSGINISDPISCIINLTGDVDVKGLTVSGTVKPIIAMNGYSSANTHIPEISGLDAKNGCVLSIGNYASAASIDLDSTSGYKPIDVYGELTTNAAPVLYLAQGSNYQNIITQSDVTNGASITAVGMNVVNSRDNASSHSANINVTPNMYAYGNQLASNVSQTIQANGCAIGPVATNGLGVLTVAQSGILHHAAVKEHDTVHSTIQMVVSAAASSIIDTIHDEYVTVCKQIFVSNNLVAQPSVAKLSKGYTDSANNTSAEFHIYRNITPIMAGSGLYAKANTSETILPEEPFWFKADGETASAHFDDQEYGRAASYEKPLTMRVYNNGLTALLSFTYSSNSNLNLRKWYNGVYQLEYISAADARVINGTATTIGSVVSNHWAVVIYTTTARTAIAGIEKYPANMLIRYNKTASTRGYQIFSCTSSAGTSCSVLSMPDAPIASWNLAYNINSRYRSPVCGFIHNGTEVAPSNFTSMNVGAIQQANYTNHVTVCPWNSSVQIGYQMAEDALVSMYLCQTNNGVSQKVYRGAFDAEGNTTSTIYHDAGYWVNKSLPYYDSGVVITKFGKVGVCNRELVAPTVISKGCLYVFKSAIVRNITQERFGIIYTDFGRGYFVANGHTVQITSLLKGKIDDYLLVSGVNMVGDASSYMLSMVNTIASGDNRAWTNKFVKYTGDKTISKYVTIATIGSHWNSILSAHTKYTNPVSTVSSAIVTASVASINAYLAKTEWTKGLITFNGSGVLYIDRVLSGSSVISSGVSIGSMYWMKHTGDTYTTAAGITSFTADQKTALSNISMIGMLGTSDCKYVIAGSGTDMKMLSYYSSGTTKQYVTLDSLEGIITGTTSSTIRLEESGHTRDPWWISSYFTDNAKLNTCKSSVFVGGSIMRMNTKNFEIADRTKDYTYFKTLQGMTVENVNSGYTNYITLSSSYIGFSGYASCNINGVVDNCDICGGYVYIGIGGTIRNTTLYGAAGTLYCSEHHRLLCVDNVSMVSNAIFNVVTHGANAGVANKQSNIDIAPGVRVPIVSTPLHMSGTSKLYTSAHLAYSRNMISGFTGAFNDYIFIAPTGYINTPYLLCSNMYMLNADKWAHQFDNYDYPTQYNSYVFDHNSNFNNICSLYYMSTTVYRAVAKNYVVSSGQMCYIHRNGTFLDLVVKSSGFNLTKDKVFSSTNIYFSKTVSGKYVSMVLPTTSYGKPIPSNTIYVPAVCRFDVPIWDKQAWVTPRLETVIASGYNYCNISPCFTNNGSSNWSNNSAASVSAYNTTYNSPVFTSATVANTTITNSSGYNYYMFNNIGTAVIGAATASPSVSHTIVHMKPGTIISGATMGISGALFVDSCAVALDVDCLANYSSTVTSTVAGTTLSINRLHLQNVTALNGGLIVLKPNAAYIKTPADTNGNIYQSSVANMSARLAPAGYKGMGKVLYGPVANITGVYGEATASNSVARTDTSRNAEWNLNTATSTVSGIGMVGIRYGWVNGNFVVGTGTTRKNVQIYDNNGLYVGPNGTLNCSYVNVYSGAVLLLAGNITASKVIVRNQASMVVFNGANLNLNSRVSWNASSSGYAYRIEDGATVQIMSGFDLNKIPDDGVASNPCISNNSCIIKSFTAYYGYDVPSNTGTHSVTFTSTASGSSVGGVTYPEYTGAGNGQTYKITYMTSIIDPNASKSFSGWALTGKYQPYPTDSDDNITANDTILYACSHVNPIGTDWMNIKGRNVAPIMAFAYNGGDEHGCLSHFAKYATILDCGHTNVTTLYSSKNIKNLPKIIHVNGYISGAVSGEPSIGETGIIASGTSFANAAACIHIYDQVIRDNRIPTITGEGLIRFHGTTILDYHDSSDKIVISAMNDASIGECKFQMTRGTTSVYNFNIGEVTDPVSINEYTFDVHVLSTAAATTLIPFVIKKGTFIGMSTAASLTNLLFDQVCSAVTLSNVRAKMLNTQYKLDLYSGASALVDSAAYKARVNNGATLHITNYGRNIVVSSGGVLYLDPEYDLNVKMYNGSSVCGLTGFETYRFTCNAGTSATTPVQRVWTCTTNSNIHISNISSVWHIVSGAESRAIGPTCVDIQGPEDNFYSAYFDVRRIGKGIATIDNLSICSGGTAIIRGYVTGYKADTGAIVSGTVNSMYIRPNNLYTEDYDWINCL